MGYGLVDIPRSIWRSASPGPLLTRLYFKAAKLHAEKSEAEENLEDYLEALQVALDRVPPSDPLRRSVETISDKVPLEWRERMRRKSANTSQLTQTDLNEKSLVRLHRQVNHLLRKCLKSLKHSFFLQVIRALQRQHRTETQWYNLVGRIILLEDVHRNIGSHERYFKPSFDHDRSGWQAWLHSPVIGERSELLTCWKHVFINIVLEWYWKCFFRRYFCQGLAMALALVSILVVWSELTFFNADPALSLFAIFVRMAKEHYDYLAIEVLE